MSPAILPKQPFFAVHDIVQKSKHDPVMFSDRVGQAYATSKTSDHRKSHGLYLTPPLMASFMAGMITPIPRVKLLDPAAGAGILLCATVAALIQSDTPPVIIEITAYELDPGLILHLKRVFCELDSWAKSHNVALKADIRCTDFILSEANALSENRQVYDAVIANPPYFRIGKNDPRAVAASDVVHGRPNIYSLFMAVAAALLKPQGDFVFITPRSFTSGPYFKKFRQEFFR